MYIFINLYNIIRGTMQTSNYLFRHGAVPEIKALKTTKKMIDMLFKIVSRLKNNSFVLLTPLRLNVPDSALNEKMDNVSIVGSINFFMTIMS
ncbi:hypothetical protein DOW47_03760 [Salmonella enterica subsp. enterica serovar Florida]|nr:hypothetical protein [Salmonella enterica subsp. enterica serovar Florida]